MVFEAVKVALDPTPAQERLLLSHAGAARFAFNAGLAHVKAGIDTGAKPEWSYYALVRWWNANKDALAVNADGTPWCASHSACKRWAQLLVLPPEPCGRKDTRSRDIPGSRTGLCA